MENVIIKVTGNKMTIEVDLSKSLGASASGKSQVIASTKGNKEVEGRPGIYIGLNVYTKVSR